MTILRRAAGAYALLMAAAVGANFVLTPLYDDGSTGYPVWSVLNWFMAPAVLLAVAASLGWKLRPAEGGGDARDALRRFESNVLFYASTILGLWFFWNWFADIAGRDSASLWTFINPLFAAVLGACGVRLWREAQGAS